MLFHGRLPRGATDRPSSDTPTWPAHHRRYRIEATETIAGRLGPMHVVSLCHCLPPPSSSCLTRQAPPSLFSPGRTPMELTTLRRENSPIARRGQTSAGIGLGDLLAHSSHPPRALLSLTTKPENANSERIPEVIPCIPLENGPYRRDPNRVTALAANYFRGLCLNSRSHMFRHFITIPLLGPGRPGPYRHLLG
jgi:hypothetical protein